MLRKSFPSLLRASLAHITRSSSPHHIHVLRYSSTINGNTEATTIDDQIEFKAETRKLLDIVANSLYSDKEVFCRELVSNAADALEKQRHALQHGNVADIDSVDNIKSEIRIQVDKNQNTFSIHDTGIGMTREELVDYLGTIAKSGSKAFTHSVSDSTAAPNIIGQFGVGFYSAFMVGQKVTVYTQSSKPTPSTPSDSTNNTNSGYRWESDGLAGTYSICTDDTLKQHGTKIVIHLKKDCSEYADQNRIEALLKKYSNFISYPLYLNDKLINTVPPLWSMDPSTISTEQHTQLYRFVSGAWDGFTYKLQFKVDAPFQINAILYVPQRNTEVLGTVTRMESGVCLYSRRVLLQRNSQKLLPDYFRFLRGVVESDDIPMNLSREMLQNSTLISKFSNVLTGKIIKWLEDESRKDKDAYALFYRDFGRFIKEGVCVEDDKRQSQLASLLRFESSFDSSSSTSPKTSSTLISLKDYVSRMKEDQKSIFYLISPSRLWAEESPYFEPFKKKGYEVLFLTESDDEFVVDRLKEFDGRKMLSISSSEASNLVKNTVQNPSSTSEEDSSLLCSFIKETLKKSVSEVKATESANSFPAIVIDHESPTIRRLMKMVPSHSSMHIDEAPHILEINASHPIMRGLSELIKKKGDEDELARDVVLQVFDNALIAAGILDDPRVMLKRLDRLLEKAVLKK